MKVKPLAPITDEVVEIETKFGKIYIELLPEVAPKTVDNFLKLIRSGFYNGVTFHRVIPGFMIQGGDPNSKDDNRANDGTGGPGYTIPAEFNSTKHERGVVSMARTRDPNSAGSQFFICLAKHTNLDGQYTAFGRVLKGMDVVDKISAVSRDRRDNPLERVEMKVKMAKRPVVGPQGE
ncbi:peptidylprolyl isomerase [bacterium]|nr:peptidylprolyl isomerase [bacterium]